MRTKLYTARPKTNIHRRESVPRCRVFRSSPTVFNQPKISRCVCVSVGSPGSRRAAWCAHRAHSNGSRCSGPHRRHLQPAQAGERTRRCIRLCRPRPSRAACPDPRQHRPGRRALANPVAGVSSPSTARRAGSPSTRAPGSRAWLRALALAKQLRSGSVVEAWSHAPSLPMEVHRGFPGSSGAAVASLRWKLLRLAHGLDERAVHGEVLIDSSPAPGLGQDAVEERARDSPGTAAGGSS